MTSISLSLQQQLDAAVAAVRALMFMDKFSQDVEQRLEQLESQ